MCEILSSTFIDAILSIVILVMNLVYVIWGLFMPNDTDREDLKEIIDRLNTYTSFITYSGSGLLILKFGLLIFIFVFCKINKSEQLPNVLNCKPTSQKVNEV